MSLFVPGGASPQEPGPIRRWFFISVAIGVLVAAVAALVAEPWFVFRRINRAVAESDFDVLRALVDPDVSLDQLRTTLVFAHAGAGMRVSQGYEGASRFVVRATPRSGAPVPGPSQLKFVLERHGLSWQLVDIEPHDALAFDPDDELHVEPPAPPPTGPGGTPQPSRAAPPDSEAGLPPYGAFVYVEVLPRTLERVPPVYPEQARRAGIEGTVTVNALIGRDGLVKDTRVSRSIPPLDEAALAAVRKWRFSPARAHDKPVAVWVAVPVRFALR